MAARKGKPRNLTWSTALSLPEEVAHSLPVSLSEIAYHLFFPSPLQLCVRSSDYY